MHSIECSDFIVFPVYLLFLCVSVCLFAFYNFVQPLATTFNKRYIASSLFFYLTPIAFSLFEILRGIIYRPFYS